MPVEYLSGYIQNLEMYNWYQCENRVDSIESLLPFFIMFDIFL